MRFLRFAFLAPALLTISGALAAPKSKRAKETTPAPPKEESAAIEVPSEWVRVSSADIDSSRELPPRESHSIRVSASFLGGGAVNTSTYLPEAEAFQTTGVPALFVSYRSPGFFSLSRLAWVGESGLEWRRREGLFSIDGSAQNVSQDLYRLPLLGGLEWSAYVSPTNNFEVSVQALAGALFQTTTRSAVGPESRETGLRWKGEVHASYRPQFLPRGVLVHAALFGGRDELKEAVGFFGLRTGMTAAF